MRAIFVTHLYGVNESLDREGGAKDAAAVVGKEPLDPAKLRERFADYVRKNGLKSTQQRDVIVDLFLKSSGHISIDDLLAKVRRKNPNIGYATVYRTMKLLTEAGIAAARQFGEGQTRFEIADGEGHHDHLICTQCGLILEFENDAIERLQEEMAESLGGFQLSRHKLELYGVCPKYAGVRGGRCPNETQPSLR